MWADDEAGLELRQRLGIAGERVTDLGRERLPLRSAGRGPSGGVAVGTLLAHHVDQGECELGLRLPDVADDVPLVRTATPVLDEERVEPGPELLGLGVEP